MSILKSENVELYRIIYYFIMGGIIVTSLIVLIVLGINSIKNESYYDSISETNLEIRNTGGIKDKLIPFIGVEKIAQNNSIPSTINSKSTTVIQTYFTYAYPQSERLSYKNKTAKKDGDTYTYEAWLDTGEKFYMTVTDLDGENFRLVISDKNNEILNYETLKQNEKYKNVHAFADKLLPKTFTTNGMNFSITWKNNQYNLNINHCNNQEIIKKAKDIAYDWIKREGYNPADIEFNVPYYCDGGF